MGVSGDVIPMVSGLEEVLPALAVRFQDLFRSFSRGIESC